MKTDSSDVATSASVGYVDGKATQRITITDDDDDSYEHQPTELNFVMTHEEAWDFIEKFARCVRRLFTSKDHDACAEEGVINVTLQVHSAGIEVCERGEWKQLVVQHHLIKIDEPTK